MKECFCGCGRTIRRFPLGLRSMNRRGEIVVERMALFEQEGLRDDPEFADWLAAGEWFADQLRAAVHREIDPHSVEERPISEWLAVSRQVMRGHDEIGRKLHASGLGPEEAARAVAAKVKDEGMSVEDAQREVLGGD